MWCRFTLARPYVQKLITFFLGLGGWLWSLEDMWDDIQFHLSSSSPSIIRQIEIQPELKVEF
jgi:hypothetical protein